MLENPNQSPGGPESRPDDKPFSFAEMISGPPGVAGWDEAEEARRTVPPEILDFLELHGLHDNPFEVTLREVPSGVESRAGAKYITSFQSSVPSIEHIACEYGPGSYLITFRWRAPDDDGKNRSHSEEYRLNISDKYEEMHEEYKWKRRMQRSKKRRQEVQKQREMAALEQDVSPDTTIPQPPVDPREAGKQYIRDLTTSMQELGLNRQFGGGGVDWKAVAAIVAPALPGLFDMMANRQQQQMQMMLALIQTMSNQNQTRTTDLMEIMKASQGPSGMEIFGQIKEMLLGAVDLKGSLEPQKESTVDKVLEMVAGIAPVMGSILARPLAERQANPMVRMAQQAAANNEDIQAVVNDPETAKVAYAKLVSQYGPEQTREILRTMDITLPIDEVSQGPQEPPQEPPADEEDQITE